MRLRRFAVGAGLGVLVGLLLFAVEGVQILRSSAVGLDFSTEGPFQAVFAAIRPQLPQLLVRVAAIYAAGGAVLGALAEVLVALLGVETTLGRALAWTLEWAMLATLWSAHAAIHHPALFDDVAWARGPLELLAVRGEPNQVLGAAALVALLHLALFARRRSAAAAVALGLSSLVALVAAGVGATALAERSGRGKLVVLIGIDALRPDRLEGDPQALPSLAMLGRTATTFSSAWTPVAQTEPAWRSLLTARWPFATGVRTPLTPEDRWRPLPTFTAALAAKGWRTHFETDCSRFNFQPESSGFTERLQPPRGALNFALEKLRFRFAGVVGANTLGAWWLPELLDNRALAGLYDPQGYAVRLARRLQAIEGPALFAFHATATHFPGDPSYPYYRARLGATVPLERRLRMHFSPIDHGAGQGGGSRTEAEGLYDELLAQADAQVGTLFEALERSGRWDNALVIAFSDHGESFHADHPELAGATPVHGARLSEEENRIVLMVKAPGQHEGRRVDSLVRLIDVGPTILEQAGAPALEGADGRSLWPAVLGQPLEALPLYAETGFTHASPAAFESDHLSLAPRSFDAYRVREDGVVEMSGEAYQAALAEKDVGAFDGQHWLVRSPLSDGGVRVRCDAGCGALSAWLDGLDAGAPPLAVVPSHP